MPNLLLVLWIVGMMAVAHAGAQPAAVTVDVDKTVVESFLGMGIQWDPFDAYHPTARQWRTIKARIARCRPGYFRLCHSAGAYCRGFDAAGEPIYVWHDGPEPPPSLDQIFFTLDFAQAHNVDVLLGEWGPPKFGEGENSVRLESDDPRWARIIADYVAYLRNVKHYTCIKYYNYVNEPNGDWSGNKSYAAWIAGIRNLHREFEARDLVPAVRIIGPDTTGNTDWLEPFTWLDRASKDIPEVIGAYDLHWYAQDKEVLSGAMETLLREKRAVALKADPRAHVKPMFLGESGILTGRTNGDQQPRVRTFEYAVMMADYVAQVGRAGWMGALAWDMDDAMHLNQGPATPVPGEHTLKLWGFWNTQGTTMGKPEDENPRPWFTVWTLMSRLFPKGSRIVQADAPEMAGLRVLAGTDASKQQFSVMIVNNNSEARTVTIHVPHGGTKTLTAYRFFERDRKADVQGFPIPSGSPKLTDLTTGVEVSLPSRGAVFLTTRVLDPNGQ